MTAAGGVRYVERCVALRCVVWRAVGASGSSVRYGIQCYYSTCTPAYVHCAARRLIWWETELGWAQLIARRYVRWVEWWALSQCEQYADQQQDEGRAHASPPKHSGNTATPDTTPHARTHARSSSAFSGDAIPYHTIPYHTMVYACRSARAAGYPSQGHTARVDSTKQYHG
jgi:hypothetical protein